ncbi:MULTISPECIES: amidohydrolase family protein [Enterococcus]|nr:MULTISPECIES: amidohydrolase family protein [Enterococcus]MEC3942694.1 amidohydrolase family protein [Enterococcus mundtii]
MENVRDMHNTGITILVGTDVSVPQPSLGGLAHGASVHHELQLLIKAGLTENEALCAATSILAQTFGLEDRGQIMVGKKADIFLVKGNPLKNISDTLNIVAVWKDGDRQI